LRRQVQDAIRQARQRKVEADQQLAAGQERNAAAREQERLADALSLQQQRIKQVVDRFGSLLDEQRYNVTGDELVPEIQRIAPGTPIEASVVQGGQLDRAVHENETLWRERDSKFVRSLHSVEKSLVPFPDDQPIVYLPASQWQDLTQRREQYK